MIGLLFSRSKFDDWMATTGPNQECLDRLVLTCFRKVETGNPTTTQGRMPPLSPSQLPLLGTTRGHPCWQWHRIGSGWSPVWSLPLAPLQCDLGFFPNSRGNKAAANLRPTLQPLLIDIQLSFKMDASVTLIEPLMLAEEKTPMFGSQLGTSQLESSIHYSRWKLIMVLEQSDSELIVSTLDTEL